jgi:hypothetical protein
VCVSILRSGIRPYSVRGSVGKTIPCDIDGGLSELSFLIDFWSLNTIPLKFLQKIQDGGDIRVGRKSKPPFLPQ